MESFVLSLCALKCTFLVDKFGYTKMLMGGSAVAAFAMWFVGAFVKVSLSITASKVYMADISAGGYAAAMMIYIYAAAFCFLWAATPSRKVSRSVDLSVLFAVGLLGLSMREQEMFFESGCHLCLVWVCRETDLFLIFLRKLCRTRQSSLIKNFEVKIHNQLTLHHDFEGRKR